MVSAKTGFQPKESEVEVVDWSGDFVVLNRGPEVGFVSTQGFPVEGHEYFFKVLRKQPGWTVGRFVGPAPKLQKGQKLRFEFTSPLGKDDSKPDLMPAVYSDSPSAAVFSRPGSRASIAEYFSLDIGFSAPFNLVSLNASLDEVSSGIKSDARCVPSEVYEKMPGIGNVSSAKRQTPAYFVGFDVASSMNLRTAFQGTVGVTTRDSYRVLAAARIFDRTATVVHSALSEEVVENEISFGKGVSPSQVREVALKNASVRLTKELLSSLEFNPREYAVLAVERGRVKLGGAAKASVRNGELFRPLDIRVGGSRVIVPFDPAEVGVDGEPATQVDGQDLWVAVNDAAGKVRRGDVFRTADLIENREPIKHCGKPVFEIPNNALKVRPQVANLTVAHALTKSSRFNLIEPDQNAVAATNESLERGLFADTIKPRQEVQACFVPAIWVREESSQCERPDRCASTGGVGGGITIERNGQMWKRDMVNLRVVAPGVDPRQRNEFYDIKMFEALRASSDDLAKKIGGF
jgi:hypothetical protein